MNPKKTRKKPKNQKPPRAIREFTAGGIVFRRVPGGIEILMIADQKGRWTIPKGHVEEGEKLEVTAVREVEEETGLKNVRIVDRLDKIHFFYRKEGKLIFMTTYFYLMEALGPDFEPTPEEWMTGIKWFSGEEAVAAIAYKDMEKLLKISLSKLNESK